MTGTARRASSPGHSHARSGEHSHARATPLQKIASSFVFATQERFSATCRPPGLGTTAPTVPRPRHATCTSSASVTSARARTSTSCCGRSCPPLTCGCARSSRNARSRIPRSRSAPGRAARPRLRLGPSRGRRLGRRGGHVPLSAGCGVPRRVGGRCRAGARRQRAGRLSMNRSRAAAFVSQDSRAARARPAAFGEGCVSARSSTASAFSPAG